MKVKRILISSLLFGLLIVGITVFCMSASALTAYLYPDASSTFTPTGWSSSPLLSGSQWWKNLDDVPPDNDTTYIYKSSGRNSYSGCYFEDLPYADNEINISKVTIRMYCRDNSLGWPYTNSKVYIICNGWTSTVFSSTATDYYSYKTQIHYDKAGAQIYASDVNSASCLVSCALGSNVAFFITQMYLEVEYDYTNNTPILNNPIPENNSRTDWNYIPILEINASDMEGDPMNLTWYWNDSGIWKIFGYNNSVHNGTYCQLNENFSSFNDTYEWRVDVNDFYHIARYRFTYTSASLNLTFEENFNNCDCTYDAVYNKYTGWYIWLNCTGTDDGSIPYIDILNPNPGNSTNFDYNFLEPNNNGIMSSIDVRYKNFIELVTVLNEHCTSGIIYPRSVGNTETGGTSFGCGQSFTISNDIFILQNISILVRRIGNPGVYHFFIRAVNETNIPIGENLSEFSYNCSNLDTNYQLLNLDFPDIFLFKGNYSILCESNISSDFFNRIEWNSSYYLDAYPRGIGLFRKIDGPWLEETLSDCYFATYGYNLSWENILNLTWLWESSPSVFTEYGRTYVYANDTYYMHNPNMTNPDTTYTWRVILRNYTGDILIEKTYTFTTGYDPLNFIMPGLMIGCTTGGIILRKRKKQKGGMTR